jgi:DNA (cytosine-5)-methyltransferase 1
MNQPTVISLFSGCVGLDFGIEAAGFRTVVATDVDHDSCETLRLHGDRTVIERDIFAVSTDEILVLQRRTLRQATMWRSA